MELESALTGQDSNAGTVFCCFAPRRRSSWWERVRSSSFHESSTLTGDRWWSRGFRALKKFREWSEIVAGPRWKTFIRRFNRNRNCKRMSKNYQYDASSYALNFDEGQNGDFQHDAYDGFRNFSTRYAVPNVKTVSTEEEEEEKGKEDVVVLV